jgi:hypothetical protein
VGIGSAFPEAASARGEVRLDFEAAAMVLPTRALSSMDVKPI